MSFRGIKLYSQLEADNARLVLRPFTPIYFYNNKIIHTGRLAGVKETKMIFSPPYLSDYYIPTYSIIPKANTSPSGSVIIDHTIYFIPKYRFTEFNPIDDLTILLKKIIL